MCLHNTCSYFRHFIYPVILSFLFADPGTDFIPTTLIIFPLFLYFNPQFNIYPGYSKILNTILFSFF